MRVLVSGFLGFLIFSTAAIATPTEFDRNMALGMHYQSLHRYRNAVYCYQAATRIDPKSQRAWIELVDALVDLDDQHEAIRQAGEGLKHLPNCGDLYYQRSHAYYGLNDVKNALADAIKATELGPDDPNFWDSRADYETYVGKRDEAVRDYTRAIELCKTALAEKDETIDYDHCRSVSLKDRANLYRTMGDYQKASDDYVLVLKRPPIAYPVARIMHDLADCYDKLGKHDLATKTRAEAETTSHNTLDDLMK
jgi:tetratricopeptide (TPR) repeat protein